MTMKYLPFIFNLLASLMLGFGIVEAFKGRTDTAIKFLYFACIFLVFWISSL